MVDANRLSFLFLYVLSLLTRRRLPAVNAHLTLRHSIIIRDKMIQSLMVTLN